MFLTRRKQINADVQVSKLDRCLSIFDLTILGVGSTLGLGIYILAGEVAKTQAGPAVVISFLIAAVASFFAGLCYAEFGARVPKAGSAYIYSYITVGEFIAFIIGWNLILEYAIGSASVARGYSEYLDSLIDNKMSNWFNKTMHMDVNGLAEYPDFFACGLTLLLMGVLCFGVKESTKVNNVLTGLNLWVVVYVVVCGAFAADGYNWRIPESELPPDCKDCGTGGFMPFGGSEMIAGAATCFFGFVGFDCIATAGEEVKNPSKAIPLALMISLSIIFLAYFGISATITLMVPYYLQDPEAPIPYAFEAVGWKVGAWIVYIGALFGLSTSLFGAMFPLPRVLYAMANDGLIFRFLAQINQRFKTPILATIVAGVLSAFMATMFDVSALVDMMSIGTLLAYTLVAISVLILRYKPFDIRTTVVSKDDMSMNSHGNTSNSKTELVDDNWDVDFVNTSKVSLFFNTKRLRKPTKQSFKLSLIIILVFCIFLVAFNSLFIYAEEQWKNGEAAVTVPLGILGAITVLTVALLAIQPQTPDIKTFKVPFVPLLPTVSIFINLFLMLKLSRDTWIRFGVWMAVGFIVYFAYGIWNSSERYRQMGKVPPNEIQRTPSDQSMSALPQISMTPIDPSTLHENEEKIKPTNGEVEFVNDLHL